VKIQAQIEALESLAELDAELRVLDEELSQEREALGNKREQLQQLEEQIAKSSASIGEMDRVRSDVLVEARQMSAQMERSREKLARCRTEREVNAAQREIEELRKLYRDREQEVEKLSGLADQARLEMDAKAVERNALAGVLGSSEGEVASRLSDLEGATSQRRARRKALVEKVQPTLYRRYELIRKRRGSAIAHVTEGICSACHMQIVPMMFQQLMRGDEFQQCPSCNRILYYRPPTGEGESAETPSNGP
jgi:predicted  nucleic acid-binding Zn-ribbon protein